MIENTGRINLLGIEMFMVGGVPMKIGEILELTQTTMSLAEIARDQLTIGKLPATKALKVAGCYSINGKKGWYYEGDKWVLEQSIYDFVAPSKQKASSINYIASNNNNEETATSKRVASNSKVESEYDSIDKLLMQNERDRKQRVYRGFYWNTDIIDFLDNVKHGNKSDLMNEIVRSVLKDKGLI
ncbi:hypothetical protein [Domibacillus aminovorans]|nr:hypothetical protein [Domibacillus aminovorans]